MDFGYAIRSLRKNPGFTILAIAVLALGIGANTAIFSVVNAVLLKPLAYQQPDRLMLVFTLWKQSGNRGSVSAPDFHDWHDQNSVFESMAYYDYIADRTPVTAGTEPELVVAAEVTPEFFGTMRVQPVAGRLFLPQEMQKGGSPAVVIGSSFARRHFGSPAAALGRHIKMAGFNFNVAGVLPPGFQFPPECDLWSPANTLFPETTSRTAHNYRVVARLKPGVTVDRAQAQMTTIGQRLANQYPENSSKGVAVVPMQEQMVRNIRPTLYLLLAAVGVLLLIACANVANLLLAKATSRTREIAIRAAVGATRGRIVRQLVTESAVLGVISGCVSLLIAAWGVHALIALAPAGIPRLQETGVDGRVLLFTLGLSLVTSLIFGLAPALQTSKADLNSALKQGSNRTVDAGGANRTRSILVIAEIALSMMLLSGAALLIKSFIALNNTDAGYRTENLLVMDTFAPGGGLAENQRAVRFYDRLLSEAANVPGVQTVGATGSLPGSVQSNGLYLIEGRPKPAPGDFVSQQAIFAVVSPHYFDALGIPLRRGRDFEGRDREGGPMTCIINDALARVSFPNEDPIGRRIQIGYDTSEYMAVVGVVGDFRQTGLDRAPGPEIFMPYGQHSRGGAHMSVVGRTQSDPSGIVTSWRKLVRSLDPNVPVKFTTMRQTVAESIAPPRFRTLLLGTLAGLAVVLAMIGLYGVMAYMVGQRSAEIGLRMALGAARGDVLRLVMRQGLILTGIGLVLGMAGSLAATKLLANLLYGVTTTDPLAYAGGATLLALVAMVAVFIPAHRATRVDPLTALRQE
ncbi:MAG: ABC transporter permease [Bryobacteraceae bacterium]